MKSTVEMHGTILSVDMTESRDDGGHVTIQLRDVGVMPDGAALKKLCHESVKVRVVVEYSMPDLPDGYRWCGLEIVSDATHQPRDSCTTVGFDGNIPCSTLTRCWWVKDGAIISNGNVVPAVVLDAFRSAGLL